MNLFSLFVGPGTAATADPRQYNNAFNEQAGTAPTLGSFWPDPAKQLFTSFPVMWKPKVLA